MRIFLFRVLLFPHVMCFLFLFKISMDLFRLGLINYFPFLLNNFAFENYIQMDVDCHLLSNMKKIIAKIFVDSLSVIEFLVGKELMKIYLNIMIQKYFYFCFVLVQFYQIVILFFKLFKISEIMLLLFSLHF